MPKLENLPDCEYRFEDKYMERGKWVVEYNCGAMNDPTYLCPHLLFGELCPEGWR